MKEKDIYAELLKNPDEVVEGTVKELAEKYNIDVMTMVGFLDDINDSLKEANPIEEMYDIVPIVRVDDYMAQNDKIIVVIPTYAFDAIREKLCNYCGVSEECILRLEEFVLEK